MSQLRSGFLIATMIVVVSWQLAPAATTVPYDIVYVRAPRPGGDAKPSRIQEVFNPMPWSRAPT